MIGISPRFLRNASAEASESSWFSISAPPTLITAKCRASSLYCFR
jgi:hypothetical protein